MADRKWMDDLNDDADLVDDGAMVDALIRSAKEDLARSNALTGEEPTKAAVQETLDKSNFQPRIPEIYSDLELEEDTVAEQPKKKRLAVGWRVLIYISSVLLGSVLLAFFGWECAKDVLGLSKPDREVIVSIAEDDQIGDVSQILKEEGLIEHQWLFQFYCWLSGSQEDIDAGTYTVNNYYDYHALINGLSKGTGNRNTVTITIAEGYENEQIFELLAEKGVATVEELEEAEANNNFDYWFLQNLRYGQPNRLEGYLFPDTYDFYVDDDPVKVLDKFLQNFNSKFNEAMTTDLESLNEELRAEMVSQGFGEEKIQDAMMDTHDIIIVASLIEKETSAADESPTISSVIYNRLLSETYPLLQIDATVQYALHERKTELSLDDLAIESPYNTYKYPGLPVGPIANPGISSIKAALSPEKTDYYFYALNSDGSHHFSETFNDHNLFLEQLENENES